MPAVDSTQTNSSTTSTPTQPIACSPASVLFSSPMPLSTAHTHAASAAVYSAPALPMNTAYTPTATTTLAAPSSSSVSSSSIQPANSFMQTPNIHELNQVIQQQRDMIAAQQKRFNDLQLSTQYPHTIATTVKQPEATPAALAPGKSVTSEANILLGSRKQKKAGILESLKITATSVDGIRAELESSKDLCDGGKMLESVYTSIKGILNFKDGWKSKRQALDTLARVLAGNGCASFLILRLVFVVVSLIKEKLQEPRKKWVGELELHQLMHHASTFMAMFIMKTNLEPYRHLSAYMVLMHQHGFVDLHPKGRNEVVYLLCSLFSKRFYIGRTCAPLLRYEQHLRAAMRANRVESVYRHMRAVGVHSYVLVPMMISDSRWIDALETRCIRRLAPSLNTEKVPFFHPAKAGRRRKRKLKVLRHSEAKDADEPPVVMFSVLNVILDKIEGCALDLMLQEVPQGYTVRICRTGTAEAPDLTRWRSLERQYGKSILQYPAHLRGAFLARSVRNLPEFVVTIKREKLDPLKDFLQYILESPDKSWPELFSYKLNDFTRLLAELNTRQDTGLLLRARERIQTVMKKKYSVFSIPKIVIKIPFFEKQRRSLLRQAFLSILQTTDLHSEVKLLIEKKLTLVATRRRTVGEIIHNYRSFAKTFDSMLPLTVCAHQYVVDTGFLRQNSSEDFHT